MLMYRFILRSSSHLQLFQHFMVFWSKCESLAITVRAIGGELQNQSPVTLGQRPFSSSPAESPKVLAYESTNPDQSGSAFLQVRIRDCFLGTSFSCLSEQLDLSVRRQELRFLSFRIKSNHLHVVRATSLHCSFLVSASHSLWCVNQLGFLLGTIRC